MFDQSAQINHLSAYDHQKSKSYDHFMKRSTIMSRFTSNTKMFDAIQTSDSSIDSSISSSIEFDVADLFVFDRLSASQSLSRSLSSSEVISHVVVNYEESFDFNKRSFVKESRSIQNSSMSSFMSVSAITDEDDRRRRKKQKRVIKKIKSQSVVDMFNEILEKYDTFIFVRQVLKINKMNIN